MNNTAQESELFNFEFEPIRGMPELKWHGKRPFTGTPYYPAQQKETHGECSEDGWMNKLYWGDNLQVMSHLLKTYRGKVNLIYIDPPFDSKADYKKKIELRGKKVESDTTSFEEKQYGDIWTNDEYLQFMYERLILCRELLSDTGSIYLHCDWHRSHYLRNIMDEVFGSGNFVNEIIWCYTGPSPVKKYFPRKHDNLLMYAKSHSFDFYPDSIRQAYKSTFTKERGLHGVKSTNEDELREIFDKGKIPEDWWTDMSNISSYRDELLDYPTQKPEALLERIIKASSNPGDLVFDCFMGSGTTQAVALKLGRRFIGADINLGSIQTTTKRLLKIMEEDSVQQNKNNSANKDLFAETTEESEKPVGFEVYTVNDYDFFRNEIEAKRLIIEALGMQALPAGNLYDAELDRRMVCILGINRIATAAEFGKLLSNIDIAAWQKKQAEKPTEPVEHITFVCMGHDPSLKAQFDDEVGKLGFKVDLEVIDLLRDKKDLTYKRESSANIVIENQNLIVKEFYPMNLLQKLSIDKTDVSDWKELVETVMIDWNYDGVSFNPTLTDIPEKNQFVKGEYQVPETAGTIRIKITDLISESFEGNVGA